MWGALAIQTKPFVCNTGRQKKKRKKEPKKSGTGDRRPHIVVARTRDGPHNAGRRRVGKIGVRIESAKRRRKYGTGKSKERVIVIRGRWGARVSGTSVPCWSVKSNEKIIRIILKDYKKEGGGSSSGLGEFWNIELANSVCCAWEGGGSLPCRSEERLLRWTSISPWFSAKPCSPRGNMNGNSGGSTTPSLRCLARRSALRLGEECGEGDCPCPLAAGLAPKCELPLVPPCTGNGKLPGLTLESGAVFGGSCCLLLRVGVWGSERCISIAGLERLPVVGLEGVGVEGRESTVSVSSQMGNSPKDELAECEREKDAESRVVVRCGG
jgi:hypothetical protein